MERFEVVCVTMNQTDFSKYKEMNIHSNALFANQTRVTKSEVTMIDGHCVRMISSETRGVGKNRNIGILNANADICLLADDDVVYFDDMEERVINEFDSHPDADVIIFSFEDDSPERKQVTYSQTRKVSKFEKKSWAGFRIAFRLISIQKANIWFTTLFGGGCRFPSGEDSMWIRDAIRKKLTIYVSKETIGRVSFKSSTWFTGIDERYFFGRGAYYEATRNKATINLWMLYYALRTHNMCKMTMKDKIKWMSLGRKGYRLNKSFDQIASD